MKNSSFSLAIFLLFVIALPAYAIAAQTPNQTNLNAAQESPGLFEVSVFKDGQWRQAGRDLSEDDVRSCLRACVDPEKNDKTEPKLRERHPGVGLSRVLKG